MALYTPSKSIRKSPKSNPTYFVKTRYPNFAIILIFPANTEPYANGFSPWIRALGRIIWWKNRGAKISWHCPFKHSEWGRIWKNHSIQSKFPDRISSKNLDPTRSGIAQNTAEPHYFYADSAVDKIYVRLRPYCKACRNVKKRTDTINCVTSNLRKFSVVK
jgi:hypothetical protein